MINQNDQSNTRDGDSELAQKISTGRRRFLQAAGIGATGLTGFGGLAAGQSDDNVIELEAVNVQAGGGRGRGEYVWEDGGEFRARPTTSVAMSRVITSGLVFPRVILMGRRTRHWT